MTEKTVDMYQSEPTFEGVKVRVDPIDGSRVQDGEMVDKVLPLFWEEQPLMWYFTRDAIQEAIKTSPGEIDFLDVGTGSGLWAILIDKHTDAKKILAIDICQRALEFAKENAETNDTDFELRNEFYNMSTAPYRSCKVIGVYPPYHLYPLDLEKFVPKHARGGVDGQQTFKEQLMVGNYHLAENGILIFNQMCLGRDGKPEFVKYIPQIMDDCSLTYTDILESMSTEQFFERVYQGKSSEYTEDISERFPELYFCDGIIKRDGLNEVRNVSNSLDLKNRTWEDRIQAHYELAQISASGGDKNDSDRMD